METKEYYLKELYLDWAVATGDIQRVRQYLASGVSPRQVSTLSVRRLAVRFGQLALAREIAYHPQAVRVNIEAFERCVCLMPDE